MEYEYEDIRYTLDSSKTIALFRANNAPLIISFLFLNFKKSNRITIPNSELVSSLSDYLYHIREKHRDKEYPDSPQDYLDQWSNQGYLRKYYLPGSDDPVFELSPATEKTIDWFRDLDKKEFVGTESRMLLIFELLKDIVYKSSADPAVRLEALEAEKGRIEQEIAEIKSGHIETLTETQIRERFAYVEDTAQKLLSDFRQIEENFRDLDRNVRKQQANADLRKGQVLEEVFKIQDLIWDTDQGRSFVSFWELLMSQNRQDELKGLINNVCSLSGVKTDEESLLRRFLYNIVREGDKVNKTNHLLIEQLRKFLDDRVYLENKRVIELISQVKALAFQIKDSPPSEKDFLLVDWKPAIDTVMDRPLFARPPTLRLSRDFFEKGDGDRLGIEQLAALYKQIYIDYDKLRGNINTMLTKQTQVTLGEIIDCCPIEKGLSEVIGYFDIAAKSDHCMISDTEVERIVITNEENNCQLGLRVPLVIFCR